MFTRNDLIDIIVRHLLADGSGRPRAEAPKSPSPAPADPGASKPPAAEALEPKGRRFISEWEVKRLLGPDGRRLKVPKDAIVSPLAAEWLSLKGVEIIRE